MTVYSGTTKDGRAYIAAICAATVRLGKIEVDNLTDERKHFDGLDPRLAVKFFEMSPRTFKLYEIPDGGGGRRFVYFSGLTERFVTKYVLTTYAFDVTDLKEPR